MSTESIPPIEPIRLPGCILKLARESKGLTVAEMAAISNLTRQVITGIEEDQYDNLHGLSFVRGYLKLYAKKLGVDEAEVLEPFDAWKSQAGESQPARAFSGFQEMGSSVSAEAAKPSYGFFGAIIVVILGVIGVVISSDQPVKEIAEEVTIVDQQPISEVNIDSSIQTETAEQMSSGLTLYPDVATGLGSSAEKSDEPVSESEAGLNQAAVLQQSLANLEQEFSSDEEDSAVEKFGSKVTDQRSSPSRQDTSAEDRVATVASSEVTSENEENSATEETREPQAARQIETESEPELSRSTPKPRSLTRSVGTTVTSTPPVSEADSTTQNTQVASTGRVLAEASGLQRAPLQSVETTQISPSDDMGARVISQTVTGPDEAMLAMGARGELQMKFAGESWVEVRDARGRLVLEDLMQARQSIRLDTYGPVEVLIGAVSVSTVRFNGSLQDLTSKAFQDVARVTLGSDE